MKTSNEHHRLSLKPLVAVLVVAAWHSFLSVRVAAESFCASEDLCGTRFLCVADSDSAAWIVPPMIGLCVIGLGAYGIYLAIVEQTEAGKARYRRDSMAAFGFVKPPIAMLKSAMTAAFCSVLILGGLWFIVAMTGTSDKQISIATRSTAAAPATPSPRRTESIDPRPPKVSQRQERASAESNANLPAMKNRDGGSGREFSNDSAPALDWGLFGLASGTTSPLKICTTTQRWACNGMDGRQTTGWSVKTWSLPIPISPI